MQRFKFATRLALPVLMGLAGCTDLKPMQAQIDELSKEVAGLRAEVQSTREEVAGTAQSASEALAAAQSGQSCCNATNEKIDGMFRRHLER